MAIVRRSATARKDLLAIWLYVAQDSIAAADKLVDKIEKTVEFLADHPRAGPARPELSPYLRSYPV